MQLLKESLELNELSAVDRGIKFLEAEYQEMLTQRDCKMIATELLKHEFFFDHYLLIAEKI